MLVHIMLALIVDDDPVCRSMLCAALKRHGTPTAVASGREAVEAVRNALLADQPFDLITLDIMMPDMNGQAALVSIRSLEAVKGIPAGSGAKVLMTTAMGDGKNVLNAFREQCNGYLIKPIDLEKLYLELSKQGLITL
jgi:two-component system chemotaxis response regulator CheY